jgi:phage-related tail protein
MDEAKKFYSKIFKKVFKHAENWQDLHQQTCDQFLSLTTNYNSIDSISDSENFGILKTSKMLIPKIQNTFLQHVEEKIEKLKKKLYQEI